MYACRSARNRMWSTVGLPTSNWYPSSPTFVHASASLMDAGPRVRLFIAPVESRHTYSVAFRPAGRLSQPLATFPFQPSVNFAQQEPIDFAGATDRVARDAALLT